MRVEELSGHWALVTGASSGIGHEFAVQLAGHGMHLVLVARREDRLQELAKDLCSRAGVQVLVAAFDLAMPDAVLQLRQKLREKDIIIRLLVNNAVIGQWSEFEREDAAFDQRLLAVNVLAVAGLTRAFLPDLTSHPSSAIINVSSQAAYNPMPYMSLYGASKAFVHNFSQALHEEWRGRGLIVQTLVPGPTQTEIVGASGQASVGERAKMDSPEVPVRIALARLASQAPVALAARGVLLQRLFALLPAKWVLRLVAQRFRPKV